MKTIVSMLAALGLSFVLTMPADAAQTDPEVIIYRFPGVKDDGGATFAGIATVFICTNFSGSTENIRHVTRDANSTIKSNALVPINHLTTIGFSTHFAKAYVGGTDVLLNTGAVSQGTNAIAATSLDIICTAVTVDASAAAPVGVALRGIRFSPIPGSQE